MPLAGSTKWLKPTLHVTKLPLSRKPVDCVRLYQSRTNADHLLEFVIYHPIVYLGALTDITLWLVYAADPRSSTDTYNPIFIQLSQPLNKPRS